MFIKDYAELLQHVKKNSRITYHKSGSRNGWQGKILRMKHYRDYEKVAVEFDNGKYQEYSIDAFIGNEYDNPYLSVNIQSLVSTDQKLNNYVIIDSKGKIIDFAGTQEEAIQFATEQITDVTSHNRVHVFHKAFTVQPKPVNLQIIVHQ